MYICMYVVVHVTQCDCVVIILWREQDSTLTKHVW